MDKTLRSIPKEKLPQFFKHGYVSVNQLNNGEYKLNAHVRGEGGGAGGASAGVWIGWTVTNVVGHGAIWVGCRCADIIVPGSGAAAETGLHYAAVPYITAAAQTIGLGTGILGAAATGPV